MVDVTNGPQQSRSSETALTGADGCRLFAWLWDELSSILGTPATAALLRRALSLASEQHPGLKDITISRQRLAHVYTMPGELCTESQDSVDAFRVLVAETVNLVGALTGGMLVRGLVESEELIPWLSDKEETSR